MRGEGCEELEGRERSILHIRAAIYTPTGMGMHAHKSFIIEYLLVCCRGEISLVNHKLCLGGLAIIH